jgi:hypothetical protein
MALFCAALCGLRPQQATSVTGVVRLKGSPPEHRKVVPDHDAEKARKLYPGGIPLDRVEIHKENRIQWAAVYVKKGLEGVAFDPPKQNVPLDIDKFRFSRRMLGVRVGQELVVTCQDDLVHTAHVMPDLEGNVESNDRLEKQGQRCKRTFVRPEVGIQVKCDLHEQSECARIGVFLHPYFSVTDAAGGYEIKGLPPGKYTLEAWQEYCEPSTKEIEVVDGQSIVADIELELKKDKR